MLQLYISGGNEFFNEETQEFYTVGPQKLMLEHSLLSISKWEAKWKKPFLENEHSLEEFIDYIKCMTINTKVDPLVYSCLTQEDLDKILDYIKDPMTATKIYDYRRTNPFKKRTITSELIYYWMLAQNIPSDYEKWHINRLLMLIRICSIENDPKKQKMSNREIFNQNAALNAARRAKHRSRG